MKQLFFRLNQQQFRNVKYKHKDGAESNATDKRGHSVQTAIDVDSIVISPFVSPSPQQSNTPLLYATTIHSIHCLTAHQYRQVQRATTRVESVRNG